MSARTFVAGKRFERTVVVPGDKSLSHRALIFAGLASGTSHVVGLAPGADVRATASALRSLGVTIDGAKVSSPGVAGWADPGEQIDAGNSGTTMRLLAGALTAQPRRIKLVGDPSLMRRPMRRLVGPLGALGASVEVSTQGTPPVVVGDDMLRGGDVIVDRPSAQVRSAVALAALQATGDTTLDSPPGFRDHTERWLVALGRARQEGRTRLIIEPGVLPTLDVVVPADPSSAAFLWTVAAIHGSTITTPAVSLNPGRTGILDVLGRMGATVVRSQTGSVHGDPVGDVTVEGPITAATEIAGELTTRTLDEIPLVALLAAAVRGRTTVGDAAELAVKESNRLATTAAMLTALGGRIDVTEDGFEVEGGHPLHPGTIDAGGDHRIAMAGAVASVLAGSVTVAGYESVSVSWPQFGETLEDLWS